MASWTVELENDNLLICEDGSGLEIEICDFSSSKSIPATLPGVSQFSQLTVKYPIDGVNEMGPLHLEVIIIKGSDRCKAILCYGNEVSWTIPVEFAEQLQSVLLLGSKVAG